MHQPPSVERAAWALAELCAGNAANKAVVLELHGIAPLVWLLDGPADSMATTGVLLGLQLCLAFISTHWRVLDWVCSSILVMATLALETAAAQPWTPLCSCEAAPQIP